MLETYVKNSRYVNVERYKPQVIYALRPLLLNQ